MKGFAFLSGLISGFLTFGTLPASSQVISDGTTNTNVNQIGNNFNILNGIQKGNNLFHSFGEFSIPTGSSATFQNSSAIENIINRVTGGNVSNIDGLIKANGSANLFLINPSGIVFGENASLDIGGSFLGTTAESILFEDGFNYSAIVSEQAPLLTISVPLGLQMGSNPEAIEVNGVGHNLAYGSGRSSTGKLLNVSDNDGLQVKDSQTLALVGGEIFLAGGILRANSGHIELGAVAGDNQDNTVELNATPTGWGFNYNSVTSLGKIQFDQKAMAASIGTGGGSIQIQGEKLVFGGDSALVLENIGDLASGDIHIQASESIEITDSSGTGTRNSILTEALEAGNSGNIYIQTPRFFMGQRAGNLSARSFGSGNGGNIIIDASSVELIGETASGVISTRVLGTGNGGDITINTDKFRSQNGGGIFANVNGGSGQGGNVLINASESIEMSRPNRLSNRNSIGSSAVSGEGNAGSVTLNTPRLAVLDGTIVSTSTFGFGNAGEIIVNADSVEVSGFFSNSSSPQPGAIRAAAIQLNPLSRRFFNLPDFPTANAGTVTINAKNVNVTDRGQITVRNDGTNSGGNLNINANSIFINSDAGITASTISGEGGNINLNLQSDLILRNNSVIDTEAFGTGNGGNITINSPVVAGFENSDIIANAVEGMGGNINITTQGIFGLEFRDRLTPDSDITASSQLGVNGTVEINNITIDPNSGLVKLPTLKEQSKQIANGCSSNNESSFVATGRGGMPQNPTEYVDLNRTWSDIRDLSAYRKQDNNTVENTEISNKPAIVEATGFIRNENGEIELAAIENIPLRNKQVSECSGTHM
ncbi:MAG: filamentous hemagglutinin N-terminal domain-containing protein [Cyanobacteria bacterium J06633_8]